MASGGSHSSFDTDDPRLAGVRFRRIFPQARMTATPSPDPFRYREDAHQVSDYALVHCRFEGRMVGDNVLGDRVMVIRVRSGRLDWEIDGDRGSAPGLILVQPGQRFSAGWGPMDAVLLDLELGALRRAAALLYGGAAAPIRFEGPRPTSAEAEESLTSLIDVALTIASGPAFDNAIVRSSLYRSLASAVLDGFAPAGDRQARRASVTGLAVIHHRARTYIDDHASLPITVDDVAEAVGVPGTELDRAFAVLGATTPRVYLDWARMTSANEDLRQSAAVLGEGVRSDAPRASDLVREIALRWGFVEPRRFARLYRKQYGVGPRDVLGI